MLEAILWPQGRTISRIPVHGGKLSVYIYRSGRDRSLAWLKKIQILKAGDCQNEEAAGPFEVVSRFHLYVMAKRSAFVFDSYKWVPIGFTQLWLFHLAFLRFSFFFPLLFS
jgi:hypothetical protein